MNILDDDLIRNLCSALDELTADISDTPPALSSVGVATVVRVHPRRDRRRVLVLAAAMIALIASVAALVAIRHDGSAVGSNDSSPSTAPVVSYPSTPSVARPIPPAPEGWEPLEWGNVRLSLPPEMSPFHTGNGCVANAATDLTIVCGDESVRISTAAADAATDQIVNGLQASRQAGECVGCQTVVLPELATKVTVQRHDDISANAILDTVGPSGTWRYGNEIRPSAPIDWKTVTFEGMSILVPQAWPVQVVANGEVSPCPHSVIPNIVLLDSSVPGRCDDPALVAPTDGVRMYLSTPPVNPQPHWPEQVIASADSKIGSDRSVVLRVGYGVDPAIGLAILSSFTSLSTETSSTYPTVPPVDVPYFAVGETVMLGDKQVLESHGIKTVAEIAEGAAWEIDQLHLAMAKNTISHAVVIQLGTNGTVTRQQYESVLAEVSDLPLVVVMTVRAPKPWIAGNNEIIRSLPQTHPNVVVLDWETRSAEVADHLSQSDGGVHLGDDVSKKFFTNLILEALGLPTF